MWLTRVVTLSGPPGSGTTTAARLLAEATGLRHVNTGSLFRDMAVQANRTLNEFGEYARNNPEVDRELDRRQLELAKTGSLILEGRLAGHLVHHHGIPALKVWLDAPLTVRVQRISGRDEQDLELAEEINGKREMLEQKRYLEIYGYDLRDLSLYDLVLDSSAFLPGEIVRAILGAMKEGTTDVDG